MESLVKVVSEVYNQWGINCKSKDFIRVVTRLLRIGVLEEPVDILHPDVWDKCTKALAEETMSSGHGTYLKVWGKVLQALQKARSEQETWKAAESCLREVPKVGIGAATQTSPLPTPNDSAVPKHAQEGDHSPQLSDPGLAAGGQEQAKTVWGELAEEARKVMENAESEGVREKPPPYAFQDGPRGQREGWRIDNPGWRGGVGREPLPKDAGGRREARGGRSGGCRRDERNRMCEDVSASESEGASEGEESVSETEGSSERERGARWGGYSGRGKKGSRRAVAPSRGRDERRERARSVGRRERWSGQLYAHKGARRGRSLSRRRWRPEMAGQSSSDTESDTSRGESQGERRKRGGRHATDLDTEKEKKDADVIINKNKFKPQKELTPLTNWKEIKITCSDWAQPASLTFPVQIMEGDRRVYSPINPKDVQAITKAIVEKGLNSAMVSTLIDSLFGGDDLLPFDIKQTCRMIFDGAGMIVFKQEWEDNCAKQLALVTGPGHPLHGSSLQRLMGSDPTMITPRAQAEGMRPHEVRVTTRAAREAIRTASAVIVKPSPWSTIKQAESETFTQFVDRLQAAVDSSSLPPEAKGPVVADCLRQQCNSTTKEILRSLPAGANIADMIKHVAKEEHLAPIQVAVHAAIANAMVCFKCGQSGHMAANCPQQESSASQNRPRGPCFACGKKGHFAKDCRSKKQGNGKGRGQSNCPGRTQSPPTWNTRRPHMNVATLLQEVAAPMATCRIKLMKTASFYLQDWVIGHPRNQHSPVPGEDNTPTNTLSNPAGSAQTKAGRRRDSYREKKQRCLCVILILAFPKVEPIRAALFDQTPWLTTLLSSLIGPIITLSLALILGPCIFNKIKSFVENRLRTFNIMLVRRQQLLQKVP